MTWGHSQYDDSWVPTADIPYILHCKQQNRRSRRAIVSHKVKMITWWCTVIVTWRCFMVCSMYLFNQWTSVTPPPISLPPYLYISFSSSFLVVTFLSLMSHWYVYFLATFGPFTASKVLSSATVSSYSPSGQVRCWFRHLIDIVDSVQFSSVVTCHVHSKYANQFLRLQQVSVHCHLCCRHYHLHNHTLQNHS